MFSEEDNRVVVPERRRRPETPQRSDVFGGRRIIKKKSDIAEPVLDDVHENLAKPIGRVVANFAQRKIDHIEK